jgi:hypothetical protein
MDANERKTYVTPMLDKIGTVNELTKGNSVQVDPTSQPTTERL